MFEYGTRVTSAAVAMALACVAWGQEPSSRNRIISSDDTPPAARTPSKVAPYFRDVNISSIAQAVGQLSGRTLVLGPGVCAVVSAAWETELTGEEFYQEFVLIAHALGFVVVEEGSVTTITLGHAHKDSSTCRKYPDEAARLDSVSARPL
jgi:type II secretory pathway component GspD/PulD (secretin)